MLGILEERLAGKPYVLGESYSLADLIVASVVLYGTIAGVGVDAYSHVKGWLDRCRARKSFQSVMGG